MSKQKILWNTAKEAYRKAKGLLSKNERNSEKYQVKKERGPVKAMFHITKNENAPLIEQQGLITNNPNANVNSAYQPFKSVGVKGGGNWVTDQPTAFPVYGTTVGGKRGNEAARRDALTTFKIEFPVSKLPETRAVKDPYGNAKLTTADKGWSPFSTWAGNKVNTMAILEDIDPKYLKNIGYVEELNPAIQAPVPREHLIEKHIPGREYLSHNDLAELHSHELAGLNKADRAAMSYMTGHDVSAGKNPNAIAPADQSKSPARFVEDYLNKHRPITQRAPIFPGKVHPEYMARYQGAEAGPQYEGLAQQRLVPNERKRYSMDFIPARKWSEMYYDYVPFGSAPNQSLFEFWPGAISRGIGGLDMPPVRDRVLNWNAIKQALARGEPIDDVLTNNLPKYSLDWDNIVYHNVRQYQPKIAVNDIDNLKSELVKYRASNDFIIKTEGITMPDDEVMALSILELSLGKDAGIPRNVVEAAKRLVPQLSQPLRNALPKIEGSWLYDYLTK